MRSKKFSVVLATLAMTLFMPPTRVTAQTETVLHNFNGSGKDGTSPCGSVFLDPAGNLYGTTVTGGANNSGIVFKLAP